MKYLIFGIVCILFTIKCFTLVHCTYNVTGTIIDKHYIGALQGKTHSNYVDHPEFIIDFDKVGILAIDPTVQDYYTHVTGDRITYNIADQTDYKHNEEFSILAAIVFTINLSLIIIGITKITNYINS